MERDRTNLFISYRQSFSHTYRPHPHSLLEKRTRYTSVNEESRGLISRGAFEDIGDAVIEMTSLPPRWLDLEDRVTGILEEVVRETRKLDQLHGKHLLPGFEDERVKKREKDEIDRTAHLITRKFHLCQKAIKQVESLAINSTRAGEVMARNLKASLATKVGDASAIFRKKQSTYLKKLQNSSGMTLTTTLTQDAQVSALHNPLLDHTMFGSEDDRSFSQSTLQQQQSMRHVTLDRANTATIVSREREIDEIAHGVIELATLHQDLHTMVIDQGSLLNRIDFNVEKTCTEIKGAEKQLTIATGYHSRSVKRQAIFLLLLLVAGAFILLTLKFKHRSAVLEAGNSPQPLTLPSLVEQSDLVFGSQPAPLKSLGQPISRSTIRRRTRRKKRLYARNN